LCVWVFQERREQHLTWHFSVPFSLCCCTTDDQWVFSLCLKREDYFSSLFPRLLQFHLFLSFFFFSAAQPLMLRSSLVAQISFSAAAFNVQRENFFSPLSNDHILTLDLHFGSALFKYDSASTEQIRNQARKFWKNQKNYHIKLSFNFHIPSYREKLLCVLKISSIPSPISLLKNCQAFVHQSTTSFIDWGI